MTMDLDTSTKKTPPVWNVVKIILTVALISFIFSKTNLSDVVKTLQNISAPWLIVSIFTFVLITLLKALQYHLLMRKNASYAQVLNLIIWQNAVSNYLLTGAGIATYLAMSRVEYEVKLSRSVVVFLLVKIGDLIAIWLTLLISAVLLWRQITPFRLVVLCLLSVIGAVIAIFLLTILLRQKFIAFLMTVFSRVGLLRVRFVQQALDSVLSLAEAGGPKMWRVLSALLLNSLVYLAASLAWMYANYAVFGLRLEPLTFIFVLALMQLVSYIPIVAFGGLGLSETASLYLFGAFGVPSSALAPVLVGARILYYLLNLLPLIYLPLYEFFRKNTAQRLEP